MPVVEDAIQVVVQMPFMGLYSQVSSHSFQGGQGSVCCLLRRPEVKLFIHARLQGTFVEFRISLQTPGMNRSTIRCSL